MNSPDPESTSKKKSQRWNRASANMGYFPNRKDMTIQLQTVLARELANRKETIQSVATQCGIPASTLHNWTQGTLPTAKNLHFVGALSKYFGLTLSELLFNAKEEQSEASVLFSSTFVDESKRYRLVIEKLAK